MTHFAARRPPFQMIARIAVRFRMMVSLPGTIRGREARFRGDVDVIGRTLLHYQIVARLGAGGMGEVWRAVDPRLERDVAIKILPSDRGTESMLHERFVREARAASALVHPNIITIHEINAQRPRNGSRHVACATRSNPKVAARATVARIDEDLAIGSADCQQV